MIRKIFLIQIVNESCRIENGTPKEYYTNWEVKRKELMEETRNIMGIR